MTQQYRSAIRTTIVERNSGNHIDTQAAKKGSIPHVETQGPEATSPKSLKRLKLSKGMKGRLQVFQNIIECAVEEQTHLDADQPQELVYGEATMDPSDQPSVPIDQNVVNAVNRTAFHMYLGLRENPDIKEEANKIIQKVKGEPEPTLTPEQLEVLFEREAF